VTLDRGTAISGAERLDGMGQPVVTQLQSDGDLDTIEASGQMAAHFTEKGISPSTCSVRHQTRQIAGMHQRPRDRVMQADVRHVPGVIDGYGHDADHKRLRLKGAKPRSAHHCRVMLATEER
jgi:hypothetical protein